jgi:ABC-type bacteriocin/lantibiotic exporter with double-glycine peptidase domain
MIKKFIKFFDKKTIIQFLGIQFLFIVSTIVEFINLNAVLAFLLSIFSDSRASNEYLLSNKFGIIFFNQFDIHDLAIFLVVIFFLSSLFLIFTNWIIFYFSHYLKAKITDIYFKKIIDSDFLKISKKPPSEIIHDISNEIPKITDGIILPFLQIINKLFLLSAILFFLLTTYFFLSIRLLGISTILILFFYLILKKYFYSFGKMVSKSQGKLFKIIDETFNNVQIIKIYKIESYFKKIVALCTRDFAKYQSLGYLFGKIPKFFFELLSIILVTYILFYYASLNNNSLQNVIPQIGIFAYIGYRILPIFQELFTSLSMINNNQYACDKILSANFFILDKKKNLKRLNIYKKIEKIEIKNLNFRYKKQDFYIFKNYNCSFEKGKITTISGPSGVGKSTLINILAGVIIPQKVNFYINNKKIKSNIEYYNMIEGQISFNPQHPNLFDSNLIQNITLDFNSNYFDKKKLVEVFRNSSLNEDVIKSKIYLKAGHRGLNLSGGQVQRILIARALYHNKNILIFDEPTNFLDLRNKEIILNNIIKLKKDRILIILSHDLEVHNVSDKIIKLQK